MTFRISNFKSQISNCRSQAGFTLVELSIAMTLLTLLLLTVYGAFYVGHRAVEKAQARSEVSQNLRSTEELLAGYIRSGYPYRSSSQQPAIFFSGAADHLTFVSAVSQGMGGRGMSKVSISLEGEGAGNLILAEETPVRIQDQEAGTGYKNRVVLARAITDFHIDYLYQDPKSGEESWSEEWDGKERNGLPRAVRLNYRNESGQEIRWVFPVMMAVLAP
ncbi:MAG: prepilin-type N-terminal cleavage/methylation domain-containing protein [Deltaproteobacteria bacterium]|nr:prepilin-type N-terminal cleavage/methylation domain-containing protein [Deltaproteobacteria bacterium]